MADKNKIVPGSVEGNFFVDTSCINCDTCRALAPSVFGEFGDFAGVKKQPQNKEERRLAMRALICCPTGSIGTHEPNNAREVLMDFPLLIDRNVYYCGFNSPRSAGGFSYLVIHPDGNWMTDAPKFNSRVVDFLERNGGLKYIFLTHRDDAAEQAKYAEHFGARRIVHELELEVCPRAEVVIQGLEERQLEDDFTVIPQPGHTEGHMMLLYDRKFLFSGDAFTCNRYFDGLNLWPPLYTWYDWEAAIASAERLADFDFEWMLPGHGRKMHRSVEEMRESLVNAVARARLIKDEPTDERLARLRYYADSMERLDMPEAASRARRLMNSIIGIQA
ncbi:MAG: MBL fold metallo-hydrolase [Cyanobacteria bacterium HKST-UBA02]|nr:MBL fold metallo-hydrolase [Cyanobacteria bacterium HKST-UBA02]